MYIYNHVLLRPSRNHLLPRNAANGRVQAGAGVYRGDFPERCAGAGGAAAECAIEPVRRPLRVFAGLCHGMGRVSSDGADAEGHPLAYGQKEGDGCGV